IMELSMKVGKTFYANGRRKWRAWLANHHNLDHLRILSADLHRLDRGRRGRYDHDGAAHWQRAGPMMPFARDATLPQHPAMRLRRVRTSRRSVLRTRQTGPRFAPGAPEPVSPGEELHETHYLALRVRCGGRA